MSDSQHPFRIGAVSFLNSVPLVHGLEHDREVMLVRDLPARLSDLVEARVDLDQDLLHRARVPVARIGEQTSDVVGFHGPRFPIALAKAILRCDPLKR